MDTTAVLALTKEVDIKALAEHRAKEIIVLNKLTAYLNANISTRGVTGDFEKEVLFDIAEHFGLQSTLEKLRSV